MHHDDASVRLGKLRASTRKLFDEYIDLPGRHPQLQKKILLALEMRWKLEDSVLIPALQDTQGVMQGCARDAERELSALRELATLAKEDRTGPDRQRALLGSLETLSALRSDRVICALERAQRAALIDARALGREMQQMLDRWQTEVRRTGDIEDEELDPVGLAPR